MDTHRWLALINSATTVDLPSFAGGAGLTVVLAVGPLRGRPLLLSIPATMDDLSRLLGGDPVGRSCVLEVRVADSTLLAIWNVDQTERLSTQPPVVPEPPTESVTAAALQHINRHRARHALRDLDPVASEWTALDVITEAQRLGWRS